MPDSNARATEQHMALMTNKARLGLMLALAVAVAVPRPGDAAMPKRVGDCDTTTIKSVGTRLAGVPSSGSAVEFANGGAQVSYDTVAAVARSRPGDVVKICLVSVPKNCPAGDTRGRDYQVTNRRTHGSWTLPNSSHSCGGA
jgi:hypothetical protein